MRSRYNWEVGGGKGLNTHQKHNKDETLTHVGRLAHDRGLQMGKDPYYMMLLKYHSFSGFPAL